jgi:uncharacterized membrane protein
MQQQKQPLDAFHELKQCTYFARLPDNKIDELTTLLVRRAYEVEGGKPHHVMEAGDEYNRSIFFLISGAVSITSKDKTGRIFRYVEKVSSPATFGEVAFFSDDRKRTATVTAIESSVAYELRPEVWDRFKEVHPAGVDALFKGMANTLARNDKQLRTLMFIPSTLQPPDTLIRVFSSMWFLLLNGVFISIWVGKNGGLHKQPEENAFFDPYPFNFLALLLGIEALIVSTLILNRQTRAAKQADQEDVAHVSVSDATKQNTDKILQRLDEVEERLKKNP